MKKQTIAVKQWVFYLVYFLLTLAVVARMLPYYWGGPYQNLILGIFAGYIILLFSERLLSLKFKWYFYLYALLQLGLIISLPIIPNEFAPKDYFFMLIVSLSGQAIWDLGDRAGRYLVAFFALYCIVFLLVIYPSLEGIGYAFTYISGSVLIAVLSSATQNSIRSQEETQKLLIELQIANRKLIDYSQKAENLAAVEERNRLARELHDSVSQTIFSMTLTAQAAKLLLGEGQPRILNLLDHLQTLSQNALIEMRTLIQELRPHSIVENGLSSALRLHVMERKKLDGLDVDLQIPEVIHLPAKTAETLFRVIQEALNNIVKHSQVKTAVIKIDIIDNLLLAVVKDEGVGFDVTVGRSLSGHLGLLSMEERVRTLGGSLKIDSSPGKGTQIQITNIPVTLSFEDDRSGTVLSDAETKED